jgi:hypothetical protein
VNQVLQGSPEALGPKWLTGNRHRPSGLVWSGEDTLCGGQVIDPPAWCGAARTLCAGDVETPCFGMGVSHLNKLSCTSR